VPIIWGGVKGEFPTDTTDETAAIQAVFDYAKSAGKSTDLSGQGVTVQFHPGIFNISSVLTFYGGLTGRSHIVGAGSSSTTIRLLDSSDTDMLQAETVGTALTAHQHSTVRGIRFDGNKANQTLTTLKGINVDVGGSGLVFEDVKVDDVSGDNWVIANISSYATFRNIHSARAVGYGFLSIGGSTSNISIDGFEAAFCGKANIRLENKAGDGQSQWNLRNIRIEQVTTLPTEGLFVMDDMGGMPFHIDGLMYAVTGIGGTVDAITLTGATIPKLKITNFGQTGVDNVIQDDVNTVTIPYVTSTPEWNYNFNQVLRDNLGINGTPESRVDSFNNTFCYVMGTDNTNPNTRTNNNRKDGFLGGKPFANAEEFITLLRYTAQSGSTTVSYGGGTGAGNAATIHQFYTATAVNTLTGTLRMTVDMNGNEIVGSGVSVATIAAETAVVSLPTGRVIIRRAGTGSEDVMRFVRDTGGTPVQVGSISTTGSATAYNVSSDYRLKENVQPITGALDRIDLLKPSRFNFISDPFTTVDGFLAHEVAEGVPECVTGEKDAMMTEAFIITPAEYQDVEIKTAAVVNGVACVKTFIETEIVKEAVIEDRIVPDYQGIDQAKIVPLLVAAMQEARAEINELRAEIDILKGV